MLVEVPLPKTESERYGLVSKRIININWYATTIWEQKEKTDGCIRKIILLNLTSYKDESNEKFQCSIWIPEQAFCKHN